MDKLPNLRLLDVRHWYQPFPIRALVEAGQRHLHTLRCSFDQQSVPLIAELKQLRTLMYAPNRDQRTFIASLSVPKCFCVRLCYVFVVVCFTFSTGLAANWADEADHTDSGKSFRL